jgi:glycine/D-amino acid oxidase-like deaminating enzyme
MVESVDFLIVGGGISGRLLQLELTKRNKSTLVIDLPENNHSTKVAAGLANPLVGKFFTIGWRAPEIFLDLRSYYAEIETRLEASFFRPCSFKRIISSASEQNIWLSKAHKQKYNGFCSFSNEQIEGIHVNFGLLTVEQGGELHTPNFLQACNQLPTVNEQFDFEKLDLTTNMYKSISFEKIIFCEGYLQMENPYFKDIVQVVPTKGEILDIETELEPKGDIYLGSVFLQHLEGKKWRAGATYEQNQTNLEPTEMMHDDLKVKLDKVLDLPYQIVDHYCGIRPASEDRKPILGTHPKYNSLHIMNGMGSKAVSLSPLLAKEMADLLIDNIPLHADVDIARFC